MSAFVQTNADKAKSGHQTLIIKLHIYASLRFDELRMIDQINVSF